MPAVTVRCPRCRRSYSVDGSLVGRTARCKGCGESFALSRSDEQSAPTPGSDAETPSGPPPDAAPEQPAHPEMIGRFVVKQRLGAGAFGTVYRAADPTLDRDVALKVPHPDFQNEPRAVERFLREARAAARLNHPHIVPVYEAGTDGDSSFIASALIPGRTLAEAIDDGPLDPRRAARIVAALADALHHAHDQGIVHRDVKPANVLLDEHDRPHLTDFGLAHLAVAGARLTKANSILGTPAYLSPEQAAGKSDEASPASDQYSLGVVLYELLTGRTPFAGPMEVVIFHTLNSPPRPPRAERPEIPAELEAACLKALAKRPEDRYATCRELARDLGRWLAGRRSSSERPPTTTRDTAIVATVMDSGESPARTVLPTTIDDSSRDDRPSTVVGVSSAHHRRLIAAAGAAAVIMALLVAALIYRATDNGTVWIELGDARDTALVKVDGKATTVEGPGASFRLRAGAHRLEVSGEGIQPWSREFRVVRGETLAFRAERVSSGPAEASGLARRPLIARPGPLETTRKTTPQSTSQPPTPEPPAQALSSSGARAAPLPADAVSPGVIALYTRGDPLKQGWKMYGHGSITEEGDGSGVLITRDGHGWLCCATQRFQDFVLKLEYQVSSPADNSGVYFGIPRTPITPTETVGDAFEVQIWDNGQGFQATGAIWGRKAPDRQPALPGPGRWVAMEIQVQGGEARVFLGDTLVNTYELPRREAGYIGLQNMVNEDGAESTVRFRNIRIQPLNATAATKVADRGRPTIPPTSGETISPTFFNGKDLTGWEGLPGYWQVRDGAIVGSCPPGRPAHTFLCSTRPYSDFELSFKARLLEGAGNSGVQIRSRVADRNVFRVEGPQCEVGQMSPARPTGSLVTEPSGRAIQADSGQVGGVYKPNDFNQFTIRCVGQHVTIRLNGLTTVDADVPDIPREGIIAWQIHGRQTPREVTFKDIVLTELGPQAEEGGFRELFNGEDLNGWHIERGEARNFRVERGLLVVVGTDDDRRVSSLLSDQLFGDFTLRFEFQATRRANGAVAFRALDLGSVRATLGRPTITIVGSGSNRAGSLLWRAGSRGPDILPSQQLPGLGPAGSWNRMEIELRGGSLRVAINGRDVRRTGLDALAERADALPGLAQRSGRIGFQVRVGTLRFRNVRIKPY